MQAAMTMVRAAKQAKRDRAYADRDTRAGTKTTADYRLAGL